jgi:hypothetical protein
MSLRVSPSLPTATIWLNDCAEVPTFLVAGHEVCCFHSFPYSLFTTSDNKVCIGGNYLELIPAANVSTLLMFSYSTAVTWALFALTQNPTAQQRLREEVLSIPTDRPTMDELNALPYLDCVVRETLRMYAPVPATSTHPSPLVSVDDF